MNRRIYSYLVIVFITLLCFVPAELDAQKRKRNEPTLKFDKRLYQSLEWRNIGPFRGGRATAVTGVVSDPMTYYFGGTGGGVWKTTDGGASWINISDKYFKSGSVGAIAVSSMDPNVIYVGMGEKCVRGVMTSSGDGMYRSTDGGQTWEHIGLGNSLHVSAIQIHPRNPDLVFVAAQGNPYKASSDRGIYRSENGGKTWKRIHFVNGNSGPSDLVMDPSNSRILYAAFWDHQRTPWQVRSGGQGSGIWKSVDGGETWKELTKGLPEQMGKIGIAVSPANPRLVWAIVEAKKGGLYQSKDGGATWKLVNGDRILHARSWYYMHVFADTKDENKVYVLNAPFLKSIDGGKTFSRVSVPHGDNHALWIHPDNPELMINGNDGGANISFNGGLTWSEQDNQPTAQFYRVNVDNQFPYWVYGGQQDNSSVAIPSRANGAGIGWQDWIAGVGGCESAYTAFDPNNPDLIYAGCYQGIISEWDRKTGRTKDVMAFPFLGLGSDSREVKYRFNWNAPIHVSLHNPKVIFHAGNKLLKSTDRGLSWEEISPDLTRNDTTKQGLGGGPITNEGAGGEVYGTIMYIAESPHKEGVIWTGSDDGLIHLTTDGGANWKNVTPPGMPESMVNAIEVSPHDPGTVYVAVTGYKLGDFAPHIYKTTDYGSTWRQQVSGIAANHFVRVVREDPSRKGLLYAGTENGLYISFDAGSSWQSFQLNLPVVPITDLIVRHGDLIAATQGRAFWVLDNLSPLHQLNSNVSAAKVHLFKPRDAWFTEGGSNRNVNARKLGVNPYNGVEVHFIMNRSSESDTSEFAIEFMNSSGEVLRKLVRKGDKSKYSSLEYKSGMNVLRWNLRTEKLKVPKGIQPFGNTGGFKVGPGSYKVRLTVGKNVLEESFNVVKDPRIEANSGHFEERQQLLDEMNETIQSLYQSMIDMQSIHTQLKVWNDRFKEMEDGDMKDELKATSEKLEKAIKDFESNLIQPNQKTFQDVINFLNKLDANLLYVRDLVDEGYPPVTEGQKQRYEDLKAQWKKYREGIDQLMGNELKAFNDALRQYEIPYVSPISGEK